MKRSRIAALVAIGAALVGTTLLQAAFMGQSGLDWQVVGAK